MTTIMTSIRNGLGGLARFSGRESGRQFWPYAFAVVGLTITAMTVGMAVMLGAVFAAMQAVAEDNPDQTTITTGPGSYSIQIEGDHPELAIDLAPFSIVAAICAAIAVGLLAAAVTRRLHDSGLRGFWGLIPLPFLIVGMTLTPSVLAGSTASDDQLLMLFFNNVVYVAALVGLVLLLLRRSDIHANRFGPPPG